MFFNVPLKPVLTFLGSAPVSLWTGIGGSFGILGQVILSSPIKDISPVLSKTADPLILKTTNFILNMFKYKKKDRAGGVHILYVTFYISDIVKTDIF